MLKGGDIVESEEGEEGGEGVMMELLRREEIRINYGSGVGVSTRSTYILTYGSRVECWGLTKTRSCWALIKREGAKLTG